MEKEDMEEDVLEEDEVQDKKRIYLKYAFLIDKEIIYIWNIIIYSICDFSRIERIINDSWKWLAVNNNIFFLLNINIVIINWNNKKFINFNFII